VSLEEKGSSLGFELPICAEGAFCEQQTQISFQGSAELELGSAELELGSAELV